MLLRKHLEMSQVQFGRELGVTDSTVYRWEEGLCQPTLEHLTEIANKYGLSMNYFFRQPKRKVR